MIEGLEYVKEHLSRAELLAQLAEEATELAQAALKMRRTITQENPTPVTPEEAYENLMEECADVSLCLNALGFNRPMDLLMIQQVMYRKAERWPQRLKEAKP